MHCYGLRLFTGQYILAISDKWFRLEPDMKQASLIYSYAAGLYFEAWVKVYVPPGVDRREEKKKYKVLCKLFHFVFYFMSYFFRALQVCAFNSWF